MITNLALFEHPSHIDQLYPFSVLHLPWELRYGAFTIADAWQRLSGATVIGCFGRVQHLASFYARYPSYRAHQLGVGNVLLLSSRLLPSSQVFEQILRATDLRASVAFTVGDELVAVSMPMTEWEQLDVEQWNGVVNHCKQQQYPTVALHSVKTLGYLWELLDIQADAIAEQFELFSDAGIYQADFLGAQVATLNAEQIAVGEQSSIAPYVVLDATHGPIIIGDHVTIMPHATIIGPCAIGDHSTVKVGAKIYSGTTIGRWCKIGGEVDSTIFHDYTNKQHDGFVGHSIIGEWVNLGADTNTSNLKNTYRPVAVELPSGKMSTGRTFLGLLCGDHTKAGINTMFSTGTVVGICANIFGSGYTPPFIPSFTWGGIEQRKLYGIASALDTVRRAMARRNRTLLAEEEALIRAEFDRIAEPEALPR